MNILIDTHICIWSIFDYSRLSVKAVSLLEDRSNSVFASVASVWETVIKHSKHPQDFPYSGDELYREILKAGFGIIPISAEDALEINTLKYVADGAGIHKDPFDRIMLAQAKSRGMRFLTMDSLIPNYHEECVISL